MADITELIASVRAEVVQRREQGHDVAAIERRLQRLLAAGGEAAADTETRLLAVLDELDALPPVVSGYVEPSTLEEIRALRPDGPRRMATVAADAALLDRIHGAWLGRAAGCALGKPVEGWPKERIDSYLAFAGALPLDDFIPLAEGHPEGIRPRPFLDECTRGRISYMARDDDMDYPVLGLHILESHGPDFTSGNVANTWLSRIAYYIVYTAERVAYRNLVNGIPPPQSASFRNPYREWIGALIRADVWGWVSPGWPERAAEFAFRDAAISHTGNGIYGEMMVAAMMAASAVTEDVDEIIRVGLSEIPADCRLAEAVHDAAGWCRQSDDWEQVWSRINEKHGHYHTVHTINNAALVVMALLLGRGDFQRTIVLAVRGGWDTDCNGATAGSLLGMIIGAAALPEKWVGVFNDRLMTAVRGHEECRLSDLARRTHQVAARVLDDGGPADAD